MWSPDRRQTVKEKYTNTRMGVRNAVHDLTQGWERAEGCTVSRAAVEKRTFETRPE